MNDLLRMRLTAQLARHEGRRAMMYEDTQGVETIGIGHSLRRPISDRAIEQIFADDIAQTEKELLEHAPWMAELDDARYGVFLNLSFNMGVAGLMAFHETLAATQRGDFFTAAAHLMDSRWARQVQPSRSEELTEQLRSGEWQNA
jgi:lysozyme